MLIGAPVTALLSVLSLSLVSCSKPRAAPSNEPSTNATTRSAEVTRSPSRSAAIDTVEVPGDKSVLVVGGEDTKRPIVHLHGMCSEPRADLEAFSASVSTHGTVIALVGDSRCPSGGTTWTNDATAIDTRIDAAIRAVAAARNVELDASRRIVIGESMGASRAEALASRFPEKYTGLVLVGAPSTPSSTKLRSAKGIALLAGENESQEKMRQGALVLAGDGLPARFWELPGATHGNYGSDGARIMGEAVAFVAR